jgi:hypothetical protein
VQCQKVYATKNFLLKLACNRVWKKYQMVMMLAARNNTNLPTFPLSLLLLRYPAPSYDVTPDFLLVCCSCPSCLYVTLSRKGVFLKGAMFAPAGASIAPFAMLQYSLKYSEGNSVGRLVDDRVLACMLERTNGCCLTLEGRCQSK